jgi:NET1-associated nuclear protein 1 (U3 small nucleolar RNA-associated protein 17)
LITLSDRLLVYDLVLDEMRYSIKLGPSVTSLSLAQKLEMMLLAVDRRSRTFAVTLPARFDGPAVADPRKQSLLTQYSELAVFNTDKRAPLIREAFSTLVTALLPAVSSDGYLVLNSAAEIRTVLKNGTQAITNLAQSTSALQLDTVEEPEEQVFDLMELVEEEAEETEEIQLPGLEANDDDDETEFPVVRQQQLSEIFDIGPAFALPPMEEMFYQVAGLFVSKPQSV